MESYYNYFKALHIFFVVAWFAGLSKKDSPEKEILTKQLKIMTRRLWYIISWPSAILTILFGILMLLIIPSWILQKWMIVKLSFVALLVIYHFKTHIFFKQLHGMTLISGVVSFLSLIIFLFIGIKLYQKYRK